VFSFLVLLFLSTPKILNKTVRLKDLAAQKNRESNEVRTIYLCAGMKIKRNITRKRKRLMKGVKVTSQKTGNKNSAVTSRETKEENAVKKKLHRVSINARRRAYRRKAAITIIRNGKIIKVYRSGKEKIIGTLRKVRLAFKPGKSIKIK
jgi:hypothetical protein